MSDLSHEDAFSCCLDHRSGRVRTVPARNDRPGDFSCCRVRCSVVVVLAFDCCRQVLQHQHALCQASWRHRVCQFIRNMRNIVIALQVSHLEWFAARAVQDQQEDQPSSPSRFGPFLHASQFSRTRRVVLQRPARNRSLFAGPARHSAHLSKLFYHP